MLQEGAIYLAIYFPGLIQKYLTSQYDLSIKSIIVNLITQLPRTVALI